MRLASINRNPLDTARRSALDSALSAQDTWETYLTQLRCGDIKPGHSSNTWPRGEIDQDDDNEGMMEFTMSVNQNTKYRRTPQPSDSFGPV